MAFHFNYFINSNTIMKRVVVFILVLLLSTGAHLQASKPIPSYKQPVSRLANFTEKHHNNDSKSDPKGKRYMVVVAQVAGPSREPVVIWVYSLDGQDISGPFMIIDSGEITVPIDNRLWGVLVECEEKTVVSVYTQPVPAN
jgi:hypothetical protein